MSVIIKSDIESIDIYEYDNTNLGYGISIFEMYSYTRNSLLETGCLVLWI